MGSDKGRLSIGGRTWAQRGVSLLAPFVESLYVSVNRGQEEDYKRLFADSSVSGVVVDNEEIFAAGPLLGILSAHRVVPQAHLFVLAVDLVQMEPGVIEDLISLYQRGGMQYEFFGFRVEGKVEPLCAIYSSKLLSSLDSQYSESQVDFSLRRILEKREVCLKEGSRGEAFLNFNEPSQIFKKS